jgi:chemotaxis protein histidine kinase CheA
MTDATMTQQRTVDRMQVRIEHLDTLLSLAGEVIITSANLQDLERRANSASATGADLGQDSLHLIKASNEATRRISQDLHDLVMAIRLVEIDDTFRLLRRPARDLCRNLGRDAEVVFTGGDVLIDKALSERLVDPLLHLLRNAVDHGVEAPMDRKQAGKPLQGRIEILAVDAEHHTEILVRDDGAGIDEAAVRARATELLGERAGRLPLLQLVCQPGLSTAENVTATSGRGVGLDLVRTVVGEFDGEISLETTPGKGTTFHLRIPKLRAVNIVDALTLRAGPDLYALPIEQVVANIGLRRDDIQTAFDRGRHFLYHDEVVPLFCLQETLGQDALEDLREPLPVIIVRGRAGRAAFLVSEFLGPQKLVNIPLDDDLGHHVAIGGTAVFTGGRLGLTVDVDALVAAVHGTPGTRAPAAVIDAPPNRAIAAAGAGSGRCSAASTETGQHDPPAMDAGADVLPAEEEEATDLRRELQDGLQRLQESMLSLESDPTDTAHLHESFRRLHAAKGHFTVLDAEGPAALAHQLETVLDYLRADRLTLTPERMDLLLDGLTCLSEAAGQLPGVPADPPPALLSGLQELTDEQTVAAEDGAALGDLIRQPFDLSPTVELQVLSALKRGEKTYETYLRFDPGRQPSFMAAYILLRRIGAAGTVLATLPSVTDIEEGRCGRELKVLWSTARGEDEVDSFYEHLAPLYNLHEHRTIPTTIFRYEGAG